MHYPRPVTTDGTIETIVVGVADTPTARAAAAEAAGLARVHRARLHLVVAVKNPRTQSLRAGGETLTVSDVDRADQLLQEIRLSAGLDEVTSGVVDDEPAKALLAEAERIDADLIVVGNKRMQGISRVLGAVAKDVATHAPCAVYIAHTSGS